MEITEKDFINICPMCKKQSAYFGVIIKIPNYKIKSILKEINHRISNGYKSPKLPFTSEWLCDDCWSKKQKEQVRGRVKISEIYLRHLEKEYPGISECKTAEECEEIFAKHGLEIFQKSGGDTIKIREVPKEL